MAAPRNRDARTKPSYIFLVSACLAGINCTYTRENKLDERVRNLADHGLALPVCPEVMGGSPAPRQTCEIVGGDGADVLDRKARVVTPSGQDISRILLKGAHEVLRAAQRCGIKKAILKSKSPSCGCGHIYDGTFSRRLKKGDGVTAALLRRNNIRVYTEKDRTYA